MGCGKILICRWAGFAAVFFVVLTSLISMGTAQESAPKPVEAIGKIRERCLAILEKAFLNEDAFVRSAAIRAAGESGDPALIPLLRKGSRDFYATARLFALQGIQNISSADTREVARSLLEDKDVWVRSAALGILGDVGNKESIPLVKPSLDSNNRMVRLAAAFALYKLGEKDFLDTITDSLVKWDVVNRFQAISYLG